MCVLSCVFVTPRTIAQQAPLSLGFSRQEYWNGLLFPSQGNLPNPGIESVSHFSCVALSGRFFTTSPTWDAYIPAINNYVIYEKIPLPIEISLMKDEQYLEGYLKK